MGTDGAYIWHQGLQGTGCLGELQDLEWSNCLQLNFLVGRQEVRQGLGESILTLSEAGCLHLDICDWVPAAGLLRVGACGWASAAGGLQLGSCSWAPKAGCLHRRAMHRRGGSLLWFPTGWSLGVSSVNLEELGLSWGGRQERGWVQETMLGVKEGTRNQKIKKLWLTPADVRK